MSKFILKITNKIGVQQSDFKTLQESLDHLAKGIEQGWWGKEEYIYSVPEQIIVHPEEILEPAVEAKDATPDVFNGIGELVTPGEPAVLAKDAVIKPAWTEVLPAYDVIVPAEYTWEMLDKSAEEAAEEAKKADRVDRLDELDKIKWNEVLVFDDLKNIVKMVVKELRD